MALSLLYAARRLRPYFQGHQVVVQIDNPIAKILRKPDLARRMIGWSVELSKFGLRYEPRGSIRGQHLVDFEVELLAEMSATFYWKLSVDGSSNTQGGGVRVVLEGPKGLMVEQYLIFKFKISNNQAEYEQLLAGLELAQNLGAKFLECKTDSQLSKGMCGVHSRSRTIICCNIFIKLSNWRHVSNLLRLNMSLERRMPEQTDESIFYSINLVFRAELC